MINKNWINNGSGGSLEKAKDGHRLQIDQVYKSPDETLEKMKIMRSTTTDDHFENQSLSSVIVRPEGNLIGNS